MTSTTEQTDAVPPESRKTRRRWPYFAGGFVLIAALAVGGYAWSQYRDLTSSKYQVISYTVPDAPHLVGGSGETVYRIDPTQSALTYGVDEKLFGQSTHRAEGTTNGIAGDLAINAQDPASSHVGQIVVNVEQLHSDNTLRDAKMRQDNLQSHDHPLAYLSVGDLSGLPSSIVDGQHYRFDLPSQLTVRDTPAAVTWHVDAVVHNGRLEATAKTTAKMSTFGIGPISIAGLVSTGDDVDLTMKLVALDPSNHVIPASISPPKSAPRAGNSPSFEKAVLPVMEANCASCHMSGQVGAAHWKFDTVQDAQTVADGIGTVVEARYMPPWPASSKGVPLAHSKQLNGKDLNAILKWARAGGPIDVPASTRIKATKGPVPDPPRRDVVLKMPDAYTGSLSVPNDYRCFVLDPHLTKPMYMTGYEVTPGVRTEIHHSQVFHQDAAQAARSRARSGQDGKPGWSCYSSPEGVSAGGRGGFTGQSGLVAGWVPGQDPTIFPQHSGVLLQPGDVLIHQIHYHYDTTPVPDRTTISLQLDPVTSAVRQLRVVNPIAPVEIPCMPGDTAALCDRTAALADNAKTYGPFGSAVEGGLLGLCGKTQADLTSTFKNGVVSSECEYSVPESGTIVGVLGHEHTLGKSFRLTLDPDTPKPTILLDIPTWNFDWQMNYQLATPIHVEKGQRLKMECSWDRSIDPNRPSKYIVFAEGTEDEMCFGTYGLIPDDQTQSAPTGRRG